MRLDGHAAIVSGGGSGLGAATAERLARAGCRVAVLDVNPGCGGGGCAADRRHRHCVRCRRRGICRGCRGRARTAHGPARLPANCAGVGTAGRIVGRDGPMQLAAFERVIDVNLIGSFNLLRLAAAEMSALDPLDDGERGVIVDTASIAAYEGQVGQAAYAASKAGVVGMTLPAARELARVGVRVVTIAPGLFHTPMLAGLPAELQQGLAGGVPLPCAARHARGIRSTGRTHCDKPIHQRRNDPIGWRVAHGRALMEAAVRLSGWRMFGRGAGVRRLGEASHRWIIDFASPSSGTAGTGRSARGTISRAPALLWRGR